MRVDMALEKAGGDRGLAGHILGMTHLKLTRAIKGDEKLKARWMKAQRRDRRAKPLTEAEGLNRPAETSAAVATAEVIAEITEEERKMGEAIWRDDDLLKEGLEKMNLTPEEVSIAHEMAQFHQRFFVRSVDILGAGVTRLGIVNQTELADIKQRLNDVRGQIRKCDGMGTEAISQVSEDPSTPAALKSAKAVVDGLLLSREQLANEEKNLMLAYIGLNAEQTRIYQVQLRAVLMNALIQFRLRGLSMGGRPGKPGYQEKRINGSPTNDESTEEHPAGVH